MENELPKAPDYMAQPPRGPLRPLVEALKSYPVQNVKELIARRLATGVYHADSSEVVYWASVHALVLEAELELDVIEQALPELQRLICGVA